MLKHFKLATEFEVCSENVEVHMHIVTKTYETQVLMWNSTMLRGKQTVERFCSLRLPAHDHVLHWFSTGTVS